MCGVVGYCSKVVNIEHQLDLLMPVVYESKIRGLHAFGASHWTSDGVKTVKYHELDDLLVYLLSTPVRDFVVHARYSTSGDWRDMRNNQPINVAGYSLAFNGVIDMRTKKEMEEAYDVSMETSNDGELFIRHMEQGGDPVEFVTVHGSFAGVWYDDQGVMKALRNKHRPLWYFQDESCVLFASTRDIIKRGAGREYAERAVECKVGKVYNVKDMLYANS